MTEDSDRFLAGLGADLWLEDDEVHVRMEIQPWHLKPGTDRLRIGILGTMVDVVGGSPAFAIINPTVDLRVSVGERAPSSGKLEFIGRPARVGRRLCVAEIIGHTGDPADPFMWGVGTFVNRPLVGHTHEKIFPSGSLGADSYDELIQLRELSPGVFELDNDAVVGNSHSGTVFGGAQTFLADLVAERVLELEDGREYEAFDLEIRYLDGLRTPAIRASGQVLSGAHDRGSRCVRVPMVEADDGERLVSLSTLLYRPVS